MTYYDDDPFYGSKGGLYGGGVLVDDKGKQYDCDTTGLYSLLSHQHLGGRGHSLDLGMWFPDETAMVLDRLEGNSKRVYS